MVFYETKLGRGADSKQIDPKDVNLSFKTRPGYRLRRREAQLLRRISV